MADRPSATELTVDVHTLPIGRKKGDESFVEGFRRKGPEGLTREVVVLDADAPGVAKAAEKVRQLAEKNLAAFVLNLAGVDKLEGNAAKEIVKAKKLADEK